MLVVEQKLVTPGSGSPALSCEIALGPLVIKTQASLEQVSQLILRLVQEYRDVPLKVAVVRGKR
jgi:hypothetical protein